MADSNYSNGAYGNGAYGNGAYGNGAYGNDAYGNNQTNNQPQEEEESSFDLLEWILRILQYWYVFVVGVVIALGVAFLTNRKWIPEYLTSGTVILKDIGMSYASGSAALMQGFGVDAGYRNTNNQLIILSSYDLIGRVVDSLPFMQVDYINSGRFKVRNMYHNSPFTVEARHVDPNAFGRMFDIEVRQDGSVIITNHGDEDVPFHAEGRLGEFMQTNLFDAYIMPTEFIRFGEWSFRFRSRESLIGDFQGRLGLNFVTEGSSVLQISLVSDVPDRDREFIDKLAEIYLLDNLERKNDVADKSIKFITEQLDELQESLVVSEGAMTNFRQENKFIDVSSYASTLMSKREEFDAQAMALRLKETYLNYLTDYLDRSMEDESIVSPSSLGLNEPMLMTLTQQLNDLQLQRGELSTKNVYYAKYTADINNVKNAIHETVKSMRASLEIEKKDLEERAIQVEKEIKRLPEKELQMVAIERNYRIDDNYYTFFLQKRAEAEIQKASNTPDNDILDKARTTSVTNASAKKKTTMRYVIIGLIIPLVLIILYELLNNQIRTPKEAEKLSPFTIIGYLRHAKSQHPTLVQESPRSSYAEMLRSIRTRLEFVLQRKTNIMVSITSTQSGDGKTFISTNLAALYAMTGKHTILVDLDIRKPNIHEKLGLDNGLGVTNYLIGDCTLDDIIIKNLPFKFDVIRAGTIPPNPGELIHSDAMADLLAELRNRYEFIVVDTSPIGLVPDAYAIVEQTDVTLFVIRCMKTNKSFCRNTLQQLAIDHRDKVRLVLSDIPTEGRHRYGSYYAYSYNHSYGGSYGYGYGYGYGNGGKHYGYGYGYGARLRHKYGKIFGSDKKSGEKDAYNYYSDDDEGKLS